MKFFIFIMLLVSLVFAKNDDGVKIKAHKSGAYIVVEGVNKNPFSVTVNYNASYMNLKSERELPFLFVLKPFSKEKVLHLSILKKKFSYKAQYEWTIGSKDAKHDNNYVYRLPYKVGTSQMVSQGFNGKFTHHGQSQYAVDFNFNEGTGIYAAREGVVVLTKSDSNKGGANHSFEKDTNYIVIEHNDATLASYAHLKQNGVVVKVGDLIRRGQLIGYSGKTGYARGAHLHFIVYKATDGKGRVSFPIRFKSAIGIIDRPLKGKGYQAI